MANDYSKLVQFFTGSALPSEPQANGLYFITSTENGQHVGKLYRGATIIAETNDGNKISAIDAAIKKLQDESATKAELAEHIKAYEALLAIAQANAGDITKIKDGTTMDSFADVEAGFAAAEQARAQVLADAKAYANGKDAAIQAAKDQADKGVADAATAQAAADKAQGEVDALETYVGTFETPTGEDGQPLSSVDTVVKYLEYRTKDIASGTALGQLTERMTQAETDIDNVEAKLVDIETTVVSEIADAVKAEEDRAKGEEQRLEGLITGISGDYLTEEDKEELQDSIDGVSEILAGVKEDVDYFFKDAGFDDPEKAEQFKDTLKEIQDYMTSDAGAATEMLGSIGALEGRMDTAEGDIDKLEGRMDTAEDDIDALEGRATAVEGRATTLENDLNAEGTGLKARMSTAEGEIDALQGTTNTLVQQMGEGTVDSRIESAIDALDIETYAKQADLTAEVNRATAAEGVLQADIDTRAKQTDLEAEVSRAEGVEAQLLAALSWQTLA